MPNKTSIMIVEDEWVVAETIRDMLMYLGYKVPAIASTKAEAVEQAEIYRPDLILMDIMLHGKRDGIAAAREISERFNIPSIYLTAYSDSETVELAKETSPFGYILKPIGHMTATSKHEEVRITIDIAVHRHRMETEVARQRKEIEFKNALLSIQNSASPDGVLVVDSENKWIYYNPQFLQMWQISEEPAQNWEWSMAMVNDREQWQEYLGEVDKGQSPPKIELELVDGTVLACHSSRLMSDAQKTYYGNAFYFHNITAYRNAVNKTEAESRDKTSFLAKISYQVRSPMHGIIGLTNFMLDTELNARQQEYATSIRDTAKAFVTLFNNVIDYAKIEAGLLTLDLLDFDLHLIIKKNINIFSARAAEKSIELSSNIAENVGRYWHGDVGHIEQLLLNLLENAIRFTEQGKISLNVEVVREDADRAMLQFEVVDTGCGIPEERLDRIFQPFSMANPQQNSSGLGLTISKKLCEMMGGELEVESKVDEGSTFRFTIFIEKREELDDQFRLSSEPIVPLAVTPHAVKRVLVVDDDAVNRRVAHYLVTQSGYDCDVVNNGIEAISALAKKSYELIVTDCIMPEMDGWELTETIRAGNSAADSRIPIIAVTAGNTEADRIKCREAGMNAHIAKPFDRRTFNALLDRWLVEEATKSDKVSSDFSAELPAIDLDDFRNRTGYSEDRIQQFLQMFLSRANELIPELKSAIEAEDLKTITWKSHSLKGNSATIGAKKLSELAAKLELASKEGKLSEISETLMGELEAEWSRVSAEISRLAREKKGSS